MDGKDSVLVSSECMLCTRAGYWASGINDRIRLSLCEEEVKVCTSLDNSCSRYKDEALALIAAKDRQLVLKDSTIGAYAGMVTSLETQKGLKDSIVKSYAGQLAETEKSISTWRTTAIGIFVVAVLEGVIIYLDHK